MSKVMGIYVKFWNFLLCPLSKYGHVTCPKQQISEKIYLFLILHLTLDKAAKFLVEKLFTSEVISQKPHGGWKAPPVLLGLTHQTATFTNYQIFSFALQELQVFDTYFREKFEKFASNAVCF